ncbi:hypothetical protein NQZ68_010296 [Dissostichus eleginoides]|nr:hypothetical protein NQZ68_010296 [Dissostichus eleginoides]
MQGLDEVKGGGVGELSRPTRESGLRQESRSPPKQPPPGRPVLILEHNLTPSPPGRMHRHNDRQEKRKDKHQQQKTKIPQTLSQWALRAKAAAVPDPDQALKGI